MRSTTGLACLFVAACAPASSRAPTARTEANMTDVATLPPEIAEGLAELRQTRASLSDKLAGAEAIAESTYQRETGLVRVTRDGKSYYFRGEAVVVIRWSGERLNKLDARQLLAAFGTPDAQLRSRAGKSAVLHVFGKRGLAISASGAQVDFVEAFSPTTVEDYRRRLYFDPPPFVR